ncbi:MAG: alkaline phosphatase family protein [Bacteroidia bacterium]
MAWRIAVVGFLWAQSPPKLIVGLVVDQMRADYLQRFISGKSRGFGRLLQEGLVYLNCHYTYFPTYTAAGHATIYSGASPAFHGIVGNSWWERSTGRLRYCVEDSLTTLVGPTSSEKGASPRALLCTTLADELRYAARYTNKTIGIALKDRSAILPIGFTGYLALWFSTKTGEWVSSTYYTDTLPAWVVRFNSQRYPDSLMRLGWQPKRLPPCGRDDPYYEGHLPGETQPTFPHRLTNYEALLYTPWGTWLTFQLARWAITEERLGKGPYPDLLAISLSSPDLAGHLFGTESCELRSLYEELDRQLADFLDFLLKRFSKQELLIFLTADHGASPTPEYLREHKVAAGRYPEAVLVREAQAFLQRELRLPDTVQVVERFINQNFYLSGRLGWEQRREAARRLKEWLLQQPQVLAAYTAEELAGRGGCFYIFQMLQAGFHPQRSGDVIVVYAPGWVEHGGYTHGTTHGSIWTYDTHVPLIWWGGGLRSEKRYERVGITSLAPTICLLLGIPFPSASVAPPLEEVIRQWHQPPPHWYEGAESGN